MKKWVTILFCSVLFNLNCTKNMRNFQYMNQYQLRMCSTPIVPS